jgi:hypothetical protein
LTCSFVPPYLLRAIADRADTPHACVAGQSTLHLDTELRSRRSTEPVQQLPARARTAIATVVGGTRVVHSAHNTEQLPGDVVRDDDDPVTGDAAVDEAHESSGVVLELFATQFDRQSADGRGGELTITVHYGQNYDNAFWDGTQLVFGDGDGVIFDRFTKPMDVMAHEFTHAVTQFTAGLNYQGQSGALNESVSDVFASMAKQRALGQTADQADWLIGEGIFLPGINAKALRSMREPGTAYDDPQIGKDPQVGSMADYVDTAEDSGGVHINSGIPNRAFALAALGIGGSSWERAGKVWYDALTSGEVGAGADFVAFAEATVSSANRVFAADADVAAQVRGAWVTVGVLADGAAPADSPSTDAELPVPADPAPANRSPTVAVRRTGGFAGTVRSAELDLDADPLGPEVRHLLTSVDLGQIVAGHGIPDGFVYTVEYGDWHLTLPERDLTPELHRVVQLVLDPGADHELRLE